MRPEDRLSGVLRNRLLVFGGAILTVFFFLAVYLFNLQIVENLLWEGRAQAVASRSERITAQRGLIWDRNRDDPLVTNIDAFSVHIVPGEIEPSSPEELAGSLAEVLGTDTEPILELVPENWRNSWNAVEVLDAVPFEAIVQIAESAERFPGVHWQSKPFRWYNSVGSISHLLGYVGNITTEELQLLYNQGYANNANLGKSGIEKAFDGMLRGKDGRLLHTVDVKGKSLGNDADVVPPENGLDVVLTIDREIQDLAEKALGPRKGSAIILRPSTGEILAMASYPSYDPNGFANPGPGNFTNLSLNTDFPFLNRSIQLGNAPASTFKLVMAAAILGEGKIDPDATINCRGAMTLGNRRFWCHRRSGHGLVDLKTALEQSCNIYFGTVGVEELGVDLIARYAKEFGLGSATGIELDGEVGGLVPSKAWKEEVHTTPWTPGDTLNLSIGQGFLTATPLQMVNVVAAIANRGTIYRPRLVKEVRRSGTGVVVERTEPEVLRSISLLDDEDYDFLQAAMRGVIVQGTGTWAVYTDSVEVAGKTGTGEVGLADRWHDWFIAYGPHKSADPDERIAVAVMVEASESYDWWAPKTADIIFEGIFGQRSYEEVVEEWRRRKVWWSWDTTELPRPGWPYETDESSVAE